jgi:DNA-binding FrmR family transcriptional regulator
MVDSERFSALRVRGRLEDIAGTIAEARVTGDVYASLDAVEHALLAVMDEVAGIAQAVADIRAKREQQAGSGFAGWLRRLPSLLTQKRA